VNARTIKAAGSSQQALEILKERYARGEITKEQYDQMQSDLAK
jgi:putative membrane protein